MLFECMVDRPNAKWAHIANSSVELLPVYGLRRLVLESRTVVACVIASVRNVKSPLRVSLLNKECGKRVGDPGPHFVCLDVKLIELSVRAHSVHRPQSTVAELHYIVFENRIQ